MKDLAIYKAAPAKLVGMTKDAALKYIVENDCTPFSVVREDDTKYAAPQDVRIKINVQKGRVVGTSLDGKQYGEW